MASDDHEVFTQSFEPPPEEPGNESVEDGDDEESNEMEAEDEEEREEDLANETQKPPKRKATNPTKSKPRTGVQRGGVAKGKRAAPKSNPPNQPAVEKKAAKVTFASKPGAQPARRKLDFDKLVEETPKQTFWRKVRESEANTKQLYITYEKIKPRFQTESERVIVNICGENGKTALFSLEQVPNVILKLAKFLLYDHYPIQYFDELVQKISDVKQEFEAKN